MTGRGSIALGIVSVSAIVLLTSLLTSSAAWAQDSAGAPPAAMPVPAAEPAPGDPQAMPAPAEVPAAPPPEAQPPSAIDGPPLAGALAVSGDRAPNISYGVAARLRWVSMPKWFLGLFTKKNVPLSSYATGIEFFRRKGEFDFILSFAYQNMSPPDGNWLGRGHEANVDTDYVQFKGLGLAGVDASFVWHSYFNDWFGMHYGAGIGVGIVTGKMLRTSDSDAVCTEANAGDYTKCYPRLSDNKPCPPSGCSEALLEETSRHAGIDDPTDPHRFRESNVPPALPIVNVLLGIDFRLPHVRGWEAKLEGGFYDAFFLGGGVGYTF